MSISINLFKGLPLLDTEVTDLGKMPWVFGSSNVSAEFSQKSTLSVAMKLLHKSGIKIQLLQGITPDAVTLVFPRQGLNDAIAKATAVAKKALGSDIKDGDDQPGAPAGAPEKKRDTSKLSGEAERKQDSEEQKPITLVAPSVAAVKPIDISAFISELSPEDQTTAQSVKWYPTKHTVGGMSIDSVWSERTNLTVYEVMKKCRNVVVKSFSSSEEGKIRILFYKV